VAKNEKRKYKHQNNKSPMKVLFYLRTHYFFILTVCARGDEAGQHSGPRFESRLDKEWVKAVASVLDVALEGVPLAALKVESLKTVVSFSSSNTPEASLHITTWFAPGVKFALRGELGPQG
jgi:hypothetical protein